MDGPLTGRVALVTGASRGIGRTVALALAAAGADLLVGYHVDATAAARVVDAVRAAGQRGAAAGGDLADPVACRQLVATCRTVLGPPDILVNNVGEFTWKPTADHSDEEFARILATTAGATFCCSLAVLPDMRRRGWGRIINVGAAGADRAAGFAGMGPHMAGKAAVVSLTRTLAVEEGPHGVTVNAVLPGIVTDRDRSRAEAQGHRDRRIPLGRPGTSQDVADLVVFLCRPEASFITGAAIPVSGGWMI